VGENWYLYWYLNLSWGKLNDFIMVANNYGQSSTCTTLAIDYFDISRFHSLFSLLGNFAIISKFKIIFENPEGQWPMWATYLHTRAMFNIWHW